MKVHFNKHIFLHLNYIIQLDQPSVNSGIVSVNNENATELNQTNITVNQPITTSMTKISI
jgi:hypothetical protein